MKRYLCHEGEKEFLVEAENIQRAKEEAERWNMTVDAIWYEYPEAESVE